jgi:hypothetical protein
MTKLVVFTIYFVLLITSTEIRLVTENLQHLKDLVRSKMIFD